MTQSPIGSPMLKARADLVLDLPDDAWFDVGLMQKDICSRSTPHGSCASRCRPPRRRTRCSPSHGARYERRDLAALHEVLAQLTSDTSRPPA